MSRHHTELLQSQEAQCQVRTQRRFRSFATATRHADVHGISAESLYLAFFPCAVGTAKYISLNLGPVSLDGAQLSQRYCVLLRIDYWKGVGSTGRVLPMPIILAEPSSMFTGGYRLSSGFKHWCALGSDSCASCYSLCASSGALANHSGRGEGKAVVNAGSPMHGSMPMNIKHVDSLDRNQVRRRRALQTRPASNREISSAFLQPIYDGA